LRTGDRIRVDLNAGRCDALVSAEEIARRKAEGGPAKAPSQTPWEEIYRASVGSLATGACLDNATRYQQIGRVLPRHNH
jgi:dihydroxy-acid dehydratase